MKRVFYNMKNIEKSPALSNNTYGKYSLPIEYI